MKPEHRTFEDCLKTEFRRGAAITPAQMRQDKLLELFDNSISLVSLAAAGFSPFRPPMQQDSSRFARIHRIPCLIRLVAKFPPGKNRHQLISMC